MTTHPYQVLARKYRPQKFSQVVGQGPIVTTLKNAIRMQRTAHAYLFCGSRGTETTLARLFAKVLNCSSLSEEIEPCNACSSCRDVAAGHAIDVLEIDGASHRGIEDIRQINETIGFMPVGGRYKIYLIDEVHMLTKEAFNALLKTLEEPPAHVKFFFCTTEPHRIPATILSRCQRFNLRRIAVENMEVHLAHISKEAGVEADRHALALIAERAEGSLRDALSLFDQVIAFEKGTITAQTVAEVLGLPSKELCLALDQAAASCNIAAAFKIAGDVFEAGHNVAHFFDELIHHFRIHLLIKCGAMSHPQYALHYRQEQLVHILEMLTEAQQNLKTAPSERTALEMILLRILRTQTQVSLENLVERLVSMEKRLSTSEEMPLSPKSIPPPPKIEKRPAISEDPIPKPSDLPRPKPQAMAPPPKAPAAALPPLQPASNLTIQEQSRFETVMRFAAKELNGSLKKDT